MVTGKKLGFKKGDFVFTGAFPAVIISDVQTFAPCCEVWGIEHEMGSAYASDLIRLSFAQFCEMVAGRWGQPEKLEIYSDVSRKAITEALNVVAVDFAAELAGR